MEYILGEKAGGCVFCDALASDRPDRENLVLARGENAFVVMNRYPYGNGHLMVLPNRHTSDFSSLTPDENSELSRLLQHAHRILTEAVQPEGFNMGLNLGDAGGAGIKDHLHWHILPRWKGDVNFMTLIAETRVIPEHILATYDLLRPHFERISKP